MVAQYCKEVKAAVKGDRDYKNSVIRNLKADMEEYLSEHPDADDRQLRAHFGDPEEYAREMDATLTPSEKAQRKTLRRRVLTAVIATAVASLLLWAGCVISATVDASRRTSGYSYFCNVD